MATFDSLVPQEAPVGIEARLYLRAQAESLAPGDAPVTPYAKEGSGELSVTWADGTVFERGVGYDALLAFLTAEEKQALNAVLTGVMDRLVARWMATS